MQMITNSDHNGVYATQINFSPSWIKAETTVYDIGSYSIQASSAHDIFIEEAWIVVVSLHPWSANFFHFITQVLAPWSKLVMAIEKNDYPSLYRHVFLGPSLLTSFHIPWIQHVAPRYLIPPEGALLKCRHIIYNQNFRGRPDRDALISLREIIYRRIRILR